MKENLIGRWKSELSGFDLLALAPLDGRFDLEFTLNRDGTAVQDFRISGDEERDERLKILKDAPFPVTWEFSADRTLSILEPVPPIPDRGLPDWSRDATRYAVLCVSAMSLGVKLRGFESDGELIVLRRIDSEEYQRRQSQLVIDTFQAIKDEFGVTPADPRLRRQLR